MALKGAKDKQKRQEASLVAEVEVCEGLSGSHLPLGLYIREMIPFNLPRKE